MNNKVLLILFPALNKFGSTVIILLILSLLNLTYAQTRQGIRISLNQEYVDHSVLEWKYRRILKSSEPDSIKLAQLIFRFKRDGYLEASIDSFNTNSNEFLLHKGERYNWREIKFLDKTNDENDNSLIELRKYTGKATNISDIENWKNRIITSLENKGYPFAQVRIDSFNLNKNIADIYMSYESNNLYYADSINNKGDANVSNKFLHQYLGISYGSIYNESKISKIDNKLSALSFYDVKRESHILFDTSNFKVYTFLNKKSANYFNALIGIVPVDENSDKTFLTGELYFSTQNLFKQREKITIEWRRLQLLTQSLHFSLNAPYILNTKIGSELNFNLYKEDTSFINLTFKTSAGYYFNGLNNIKLTYYNESSNLLSSTLENSSTQYQKKGYGAGIEAFEQDNIYLPRKGYRISSEILISQKKQNGTTKQKTSQDGWQGSLYASYYQPLSRYISIKFANTLSWLKYDSVFYNENLRIGGNKILRGFDEESIRTPYYNVSTLETHVFIDKNSSVYLFNDFGIYTQSNTNKQAWANGFGLGFNIFSKMGLFTIQYALGSTPDIPIKFRNSKIHIGYVNNL